MAELHRLNEDELLRSVSHLQGIKLAYALLIVLFTNKLLFLVNFYHLRRVKIHLKRHNVITMFVGSVAAIRGVSCEAINKAAT